MKRVIINLVDNAIEAMGRSGAIVIETARDVPNSLVRVVVADTGPGIPPAERDKLFLPYYSTKGRGSGLGLAIVRRIVAEHGGSIDVFDNHADRHPVYHRVTSLMPSILVVDDEPGVRSSISGVLRDEGFDVDAVGTGEECLERANSDAYDVIVLDIWLPGLDGLTTLQRLRERQIDSQVVIISGHGNIESAVRAIKMGAFDFIEKPLSLEKTVLVVRNALRQRDLEAENRVLRAKVDRQQQNTMVGESAPMLRLREQVALAAPTNGRVLILGDNGTGKELVARTIHQSSRRKNGPFIEVNCAAIPEELIESELFGHVRGAFTGAVADKPGRFEQANTGTIFLDEIADMSLKTQAKVLRVLQEQVMERVGGTQRIKVDVRVVAATNKDLVEEIRAGRFREDLYFRLNVVPIFVPSLRERQDDIPPLADHFMALLATEYGRRPKRMAPEAAARLRQYAWPGNVRELRNVIERLMIMVQGDTITAQDLGFLGRDGVPDALPAHGPGPAAVGGARRVREGLHPADAGRAAGQHVANRRSARRRALESLQEAARVWRHAAQREVEPRRTRRARRLGCFFVSFVSSWLSLFSRICPLENPSSRRKYSAVWRQRRGRHQPDDLAFKHLHAVSLGLALDQIEHPIHRRLLVVGQVHRHLDDAAIFERNAHGLDEPQAAAAHADGRRDLLGDVQPIGGQVDVVGDERHARADHRRAGAGVRRAPARSRVPMPVAPSWPRALRTRRAGCLRGSCGPGWSTRPRRDRPATRNAPRHRRRSLSPAPRTPPSSRLRWE